MKHGIKKPTSKLKVNFDRTQYNLFSILLGGVSLFVVLTNFSAPELNEMFLGENPFAIKRDIIEGVMNNIFTVVALIAVSMQLVAEICGENWPARIHKAKYYIYFSLIMAVVIGLLMWGLYDIGKNVAKSKWWPKVTQNHEDFFKSAEFLVEHDGWRPDQLELKGKIPDSYRLTNLKGVEDTISINEKLLELPPTNADLRVRLNRLKFYFGQGHP
jgi:hypothetical protein